MFISGIVIGLLLGLIFAVDSRVDRQRWRTAIERNRKQVFCQALNDTDICDRLAEKLEIQADGGDAPGDFVKWAVHETWKEADAL